MLVGGRCLQPCTSQNATSTRAAAGEGILYFMVYPLIYNPRHGGDPCSKQEFSNALWPRTMLVHSPPNVWASSSRRLECPTYIHASCSHHKGAHQQLRASKHSSQISQHSCLWQLTRLSTGISMAIMYGLNTRNPRRITRHVVPQSTEALQKAGVAAEMLMGP